MVKWVLGVDFRDVENCGIFLEFSVKGNRFFKFLCFLLINVFSFNGFLLDSIGIFSYKSMGLFYYVLSENVLILRSTHLQPSKFSNKLT